MKKVIEIIKIFNYTKLLVILAIIMICFCIFSSVYTVRDGEIAVLRTLGRVSDISEPGIHLKFPFPIQEIDVINVSKINSLEIGFKESLDNQKYDSDNKENLMLTNDENIICVGLIVEWKINDPHAFLFNAKEPESILKNTVMSSLTSTIASFTLDSILTDGKTDIQNKIKETLENVILKYELGIEIISVKIHDAQPPNQVQAAFQSVTDAKEQKNTLINKADEYKNQKIHAAEGEADKMIKEAEAYYEERISKANAEIARFNSIYNEYKISKNVTKTRMLIEVLEEVLPGANIYIMDDKSGTIRYLPIKEFGGENWWIIIIV